MVVCNKEECIYYDDNTKCDYCYIEEDVVDMYDISEYIESHE